MITERQAELLTLEAKLEKRIKQAERRIYAMLMTAVLASILITLILLHFVFSVHLRL